MAEAPRIVTRPLIPSASDLKVAPKPVLPAEALSSEAALDRYDIDLEHGQGRPEGRRPHLRLGGGERGAADARLSLA